MAPRISAGARPVGGNTSELLDLPEEDLFDEPQAIADLEFVKRVETTLSKRGKPTGSVIDRYRYPTQEMEIRRGHELKLKTEEKFGEVVRVNRAEHSIDIRKGRKMAAVHPPSVFEHKHINTEVIEDAIFAIGENFARSEAWLNVPRAGRKFFPCSSQ